VAEDQWQGLFRLKMLPGKPGTGFFQIEQYAEAAVGSVISLQLVCSGLQQAGPGLVG
jgi:hypothetical protein